MADTQGTASLETAHSEANVDGENASHRSPDMSDTAYRAFQVETGASPSGGHTGLIACVLFVVASALILVALTQGANAQQLLIAAIVVLLANLIAGVLWVSSQSVHH